MNTVATRYATLEDLNTLLQFEQGVIAAERPFDETLKEGAINYYDLQELILSEDAAVVVATMNTEIIASGYAKIVQAKAFYKFSHYAYLGFMYVKPAYRGKGINQLVLQQLSSWALSKNITELRLEVYSDNLPAIHAYRKAGFKPDLTTMRMEIQPT
ncbi:GNAT family N-acetyltransferase [Panacibacter sp. DH6]|uniref:GNAT family N-acetyltransferase n=1 Tax=Panacibacter microcysteis TaxID=2793269 RepID=A0A931MD72_9BACT|nr:GNAT family N-acetyltransferase [Panacibacter microcysteis]